MNNWYDIERICRDYDIDIGVAEAISNRYSDEDIELNDAAEEIYQLSLDKTLCRKMWQKKETPTCY